MNLLLSKDDIKEQIQTLIMTGQGFPTFLDALIETCQANAENCEQMHYHEWHVGATKSWRDLADDFQKIRNKFN